MKIRYFLSLSIALLLTLTNGITSSGGMSVNEGWQQSTVYIQNPSVNIAGTGFLVGRKFNKTTYRIFFVTNKHILKPKPLEVGIGIGHDENNMERDTSSEVKRDYSANIRIFLTYKEDNDLSLRGIDINS